MAKFREHRRKRTRNGRGFRPRLDLTGDGATPLDRRLLLSRGFEAVAGHSQLHPAAQHKPSIVHAIQHKPSIVHAIQHKSSIVHATYPAKASHPPKRLTPVQEINSQFATFLAQFRQVENYYVASINEQSTGTASVSTQVQTAYAAGSPVMEVDDASVFGPEGTYTTPVTATASVGSVTIGTFSLIGSSGNQLVVNPSDSSFIPLNPGTVISATVPTTAVTNAATIFPSYITNSTIQLGVILVQYFNNVPFALPNKSTPPHTSTQEGAIQELTYLEIAGAATTSLKNSLLAITLPTSPGSSLKIYDSAVNVTVNASRLKVLEGVRQIYAGNIQVPGTSASLTTSGTTSGTSSTAG